MTDLTVNKLSGGLCGLYNFGQTCYLNSILQSFIHNSYLLHVILNKNFTINNNFEENCLTHEIDKLLTGSQNDNCVIVPKSLIITLNNIYNSDLNEQNDPDEYYEKIIDRLNEETSTKVDINIDDIENIYDKEWITFFNKQIGFVTDNFYGQYKSEILCLSCNHKHLTYNPYITLKLELVNSNILECLKMHLSWENNIDFVCDKCKKENNQKKRLTLIKIPNILVITIKRYNNIFEKNNNPIEVSHSFTIDSNKLELYCIINHFGPNIYCGHYTCYIKYTKDQEWYHMNDNEVEKIDINKINTSNIYMLFYKKLQ